MLIRNLDIQRGLVNGAQGTIDSFHWSSPKGKQCTSEMPLSVDVIFDNNMTMSASKNKNVPVSIKPITVKFLGNNHKYVTRTQLSLVLSCATTVHKVQGLTVSKAVMDLGPSMFSSGMAYVALSRVPSLSSLYISRLCPSKIMASKGAKQEMKILQNQTPIEN